MPTVFSAGGIEVRKLALGPYDNNCYVLLSKSTGESLIVDAPAEPEQVLAEVAGTQVKALLITHCHFDHILGYETLKKATKAPVWVHRSEAAKLSIPPEHHFEHGERIQFGAATLEALHVPGHTTGGTSLLWNEQLFSGDVLFPNGPGRTASPQDFRQLVGMLAARLFTLPDTVAIHPGHGAGTLMGREKEQFRRFQSRPHAPDLRGDVLWLNA